MKKAGIVILGVMLVGAWAMGAYGADPKVFKLKAQCFTMPGTQAFKAYDLSLQ